MFNPRMSSVSQMELCLTHLAFWFCQLVWILDKDHTVQPDGASHQHPAQLRLDGSQKATQPFGQAAIWPSSHLTKQPFGQAAIRPSSHSAKQPFGQAAIWPSSHSAKQPFGQAAIRPSSHSTKQPFRQAVIQPCSDSAMQPCSHAAMQPCSHAAMQPRSLAHPTSYQVEQMPVEQVSFRTSVTAPGGNPTFQNSRTCLTEAKRTSLLRKRDVLRSLKFYSLWHSFVVVKKRGKNEVIKMLILFQSLAVFKSIENEH